MTLIPYLTYKSAESDKHNRYEMVAIHTNGFPAGLVHIDTFFVKDDDDWQERVYGAIYKRGETVEVELTLIAAEGE